MFNKVLVVSILFSISLHFSECDKLLAVTTMVRHGIRLGSNEGFYPNDPYYDLRNENPSDQLLNLGIQDLYNVGLWMRNHYSNFLPLKYVPNDIFVQSIDFDRCLMSAEALLAALYPPFGNEVWNPKIRWQPVPIHTAPNKNDIMLQWSTCPYYSLHSRKATELRDKISRENAGLFKFLTEETGSPINLSKVLLLYNILEGEKMLNLTRPIWTHGVISEIKPLVEVNFEIQTIAKRLKMLRAGPLIHRILTQFERAISGEHFDTNEHVYRKMMLYVTADMSIYFLADSLGVEDIGVVNYGFSIYFELREADNGSHFVDIFFRNSTDVDVPSHHTNIRGFGKTMSFDTFKDVAGRIALTLTDWGKLCDELVQSDSSTN